MPKNSILRISPKELNFPPPYNRVITSVLNIQNTSDEFPVTYKVKTTAPQRYCVRPNTGVLPPLESVEVQVLLNHTKDAPLSVDGEDKFQIQSILLKESFSEIKEVWTKATPEQIIKQKLKAKFTPVSKPDKDNKPVNKPPEAEHTTQGEDPQPAILPKPTLQQAQDQPSAQPALDTHSDPPREAPTSPSATSSQSMNPIKPQLQSRATSDSTLLDVHASLRKALDQVLALTSEKETASAQNQMLSQQLNSLQRHVKELQEKNNAEVGLRQRKTEQHSASTHNNMHTNNVKTRDNGDTKLMIIGFVLILFAFFLGRWMG